MKATLQRHLIDASETATRVQECRVTNTRRRDGSSGTVQYDVRLADPATGHSWNLIVTGITYGGGRTRRVWDSIRRSSALAVDPRAPVAMPPFAYVPELDVLLQVFPHDHRLPGLARLIAGPPSELAPALLEEFGAGSWELSKWQAETVQYRVDMRVILRLSVAATDASSGRSAERQFFAKVYRDVDDGRHAHRVQRDLHERASAVTTNLVVAKPIFYGEELRTLVTGALPGTSLAKIIARGKGSIEAVKTAARAVAEFHRLDVDAPLRPYAEEMARLREAQERIASARPDLADEVRDMVRTVSSGLANAPSSLIHGDLKPEHMLIDGDRVALIDFDLAAAADPVVDIAHLLAFLRQPRDRSRSRGDAFADIGQVFVDEYFSHVPETWRARLPLHHAMTSIHRAVSLCRRPATNQQRRVEDVLREGQAFLERGADGSLPSYKRRLTRSIAR
jgi:aminoglycoside phosphotransferase (APT) family kinase protein